MVFNAIDHIGVLSQNIEEDISSFRACNASVVLDERKSEYNIKVKLLEFNGVFLEYLEPYDEGRVMNLLKYHGPGFHHVAFRVSDINETVSTLRDRGVAFQSKEPRTGIGESLIIYIDKRDTGGLPVELVELLPGDVRLEQ